MEARFRGGAERGGASFQNCQEKKATVDDWKITILLPWYKFSLFLNFCPNIWRVKHSPLLFKVVGGGDGAWWDMVLKPNEFQYFVPVLIAVHTEDVNWVHHPNSSINRDLNNGIPSSNIAPVYHFTYDTISCFCWKQKSMVDNILTDLSICLWT